MTVIDTLVEKGIRDDYIVLVGGAPLNEEFGKAIGADAYCRDAAVAVEAPFGSSLNFETDEVDWFHLDQVDQLPLHFGFASAWPHLRAIVER